MTRKIIGALCVLGLLATCRKSETPASPTAPTVTPTVASVLINGPNPIQPGETRQFSVIARLSDGTTQDVTSAATWRTSNATTISVTPSGLVTATTAGEANISVTYQNRFASLIVLSLPSETGILTGYVRESTFGITNARVEIVGGQFAGKSVFTTGGGLYRIYGVAGDLQVRTSAPDYVAQTAQINVPPYATPRRDQTLNFDLAPVIPVLSLGGNYRVTLTPSASCATKLPPDLGTRQYIASVTQNGSALTIVLAGPEFATSSGKAINQFGGRAKSNAVELTLGNSYYYYYYYYSFGFVERLSRPPVGQWGFSSTSYLTAIGKAAGPASASNFSTALNGTLTVVDAPNGWNSRRTTVNSCRATDHQLMFVR
jgi:hypothetical protein